MGTKRCCGWQRAIVGGSEESTAAVAAPIGLSGDGPLEPDARGPDSVGMVERARGDSKPVIKKPQHHTGPLRERSVSNLRLRSLEQTISDHAQWTVLSGPYGC